jgi:hypothetical protein
MVPFGEAVGAKAERRCHPYPGVKARRLDRRFTQSIHAHYCQAAGGTAAILTQR